MNHALHDHALPRQPRVPTWRRIETKRRPRARITISDVMQTQPVAVHIECTLDRALGIMVEHGINGLPVVDAEGRIAGILTEKDALKLFHQPDATHIASVMSLDPIAVPIGTPLVDVLDHFMATESGRLLIHEDGKLIGVVTRSQLIPKILELLRGDARARRIGVDHAGGATLRH